METTSVSENLSVSPQITAEDLQKLAEQGFRSIICNRPDGEGEDQPSFDEIEAAAKKAGLEARYIPIVPGIMTEAEATAFSNALNEMPGPVLAYCRTGNRSTMLWQLSQRQSA